MLVVQRFADRADIRRGDRKAARDSGSIDGAIRQKSGRVVVNHVEVAGSAARRWMVWKRRKIIANRLDAGLSGVATFGEVDIKSQVDSVDVVCSGLWLGIGNDRDRRSRGSALAVAPEDGVA